MAHNIKIHWKGEHISVSKARLKRIVGTLIKKKTLRDRNITIYDKANNRIVSHDSSTLYVNRDGALIRYTIYLTDGYKKLDFGMITPTRMNKEITREFKKVLNMANVN